MKFKKNDTIVFVGKPTLLNKNNIYLFEAQGVVKKTYKLKFGDSFRVVDFISNRMILLPINVNIDNDYWFYSVPPNDNSFELLVVVGNEKEKVDPLFN